MKQISLVIPGSSAGPLDVSITPGSTARDLIKAARLPKRSWLRRANSPAFLGEDEDLYSQVGDGEKLIVTPHMKVGR